MAHKATAAGLRYEIDRPVSNTLDMLRLVHLGREHNVGFDYLRAMAANPELQEREALKSLHLTAVMTDALRRRGIPDLTARVAAELGTLASTIAYERWSQNTTGDDFSQIARQTLDDVQACSAFH